MELRHLRYFVAVAEQRGFLNAARHLRIAQPALSRQIRDLESEVGVKLFRREARGVTLTTAGEAFLGEARNTLAGAARAIAIARSVDEESSSALQFAHGSEMGVYGTTTVPDLVAAFRQRHPAVKLRVTNYAQTALLAAVRTRKVDVAATFLMEWPDREFEAYRLRDVSLTGVMLGAAHPLAGQRSISLSHLREFPFLARSSEQWPENYRLFLIALRERGLIPAQPVDGSGAAPSAGVELAAGHAWSLSNDALAAPVLAATKSIVFRPFVEEPICAWLALIWLPDASRHVEQLIEVARALCPGERPAEDSLGFRDGSDADSDGDVLQRIEGLAHSL